MNINICGASKYVFDKDISLMLPDAKKQEESRKECSAANDLEIFEEINKEKMDEEELGAAISSHLTEVTMKYWSEESKNLAVVNKVVNSLKIPANCSGICVPILNEALSKKI